MSILTQVKRLRQEISQAVRSDNHSAYKNMLAEYGAFLEQCTQSDTALTTREIEAVSDLNITFMLCQFKLLSLKSTGINVDLTKIATALDWNLSHNTKVPLQTRACNLLLRGTLCLNLGVHPVLSLLHFDTVISLSNRENDIEYVTLATAYRLRSIAIKEIYRTAVKDDAESLLALIEHSDALIRDSGGKTPLHRAALQDDPETIAFLLDNRASEVDETDKSGWTALNYAFAHKKAWTCVILLLENGADIRKTDIHGNTLLHCAVLRTLVEAVEFLLKNGADADINAVNRHGETPLALAELDAESDEAFEIAAILRKYGGRK